MGQRSQRAAWGHITVTLDEYSGEQRTLLNWMDAIPMIRPHSLGVKIMAGVGLAGLISLLCMGGFSLYKMEKAILEENFQGVNKLTFGVVSGLENIMLAGDSELARNLANRLRNMEDVESFRILRLDSQEAFQEGQEAPEDEETGWVGYRHFDASKVDENFAQAVQTKQRVRVDHKGKNGENQQTYFVPILNSESCHACHGDQHDVRGVLKITVSIDEMIDNITRTRLDLLIMLVVSITFFLALLHYFLKKLVINPVNDVKEKMHEFAEGENPDLTQQLIFDSKDEIGELVHWFNQFLEVIHEIVAGVKQSTETLNALGEKLNEASEYMGDGVDGVREQTLSSTDQAVQMREQMETVSRITMGVVALLESSVEKVSDVHHSMVTISAASEQANINLRSVADNTQNMSGSMAEVQSAASRSNDNFHTIASSVEALGESFHDVRKSCEQAQEDAGQAVNLSRETSELVQLLEEATKAITRTVGEIRQIADQTNMLALNAAIEAAGAGQAGRGFAVVANEVKQLASRTAQATTSITKDTKSIQERTKKAIQATEQVAEMIEAVGVSNQQITESVDIQTSALHEINGAISQSVQEMAAVTDSINDSSEGISESARNVDEISLGIDEVTRNVALISTSVDDLAEAVKRGADQGKSSVTTVVDVARSSQSIVAAMATSAQSAEGIQALSLSVKQQAKTLAELGQTLNSQLNRFICDTKRPS
uniref:Putative methyl-accepting chemotaxis sensory transducer n=1 Tax=Magnetococcus massalia (strain MO-1) TaxID=451514 RepID=A0A1S7LPJ3_MAGMO|nr:Putative methyl-accepting chemotaxis sensory transducer [Candidatus Magnetococcus massalia]